MLMLRKKRGNKGFTLIELMVVVAILAILALVAIPRILEALDNARRSEVVATASTLSNALERYKIEVESYPTLRGDGTAIGTNWDVIVDPTGDYNAFFDELIAIEADPDDSPMQAADIPPLGDYLDMRNIESLDVLRIRYVDRTWHAVELEFNTVGDDTGRKYCIITPQQLRWFDNNEDTVYTTYRDAVSQAQ